MPITSNVTYKITCDGCGYEWDSSFGDTYDNLINYVSNTGAMVTAVRINEESDPCSRERRVTCEAVIQALDTIEAGGTDE